jgi:hypothetical protein
MVKFSYWVAWIILNLTTWLWLPVSIDLLFSRFTVPCSNRSFIWGVHFLKLYNLDEVLKYRIQLLKINPQPISTNRRNAHYSIEFTWREYCLVEIFYFHKFGKTLFTDSNLFLGIHTGNLELLVEYQIQLF